ncbi:hypothetical protein FQN50_001812 [Emmonsiellopsis sp. PD_5]|nr:hypothetical protein FQN50_001812 [Emmonsiellopsis sp. PD_5]
MNGTLIYRIGRRPIRFKTRPGLENFMMELFTRYKVMVWTSSQPGTVKEVLDRAFTKEERKMLVATWARDTLGLTKAQYNEKVQVYKRLNKVWADPKIRTCYPELNDGDDVVGNIKPKSKGKKKKKLLNTQTTDDPNAGEWNQTNTVLIDDSALKALAQPHNIIEIPEFTNDPAVDEEKILDTVLRQLRILARQVDVSRKLREWEQKRTELFRSSSLLGAQGDHHGGEPRSHSKADIEQFWEEQLRLDEEAIAQMDLQAQVQQALVEANVSPPAAKISVQDQFPSTNSPPPTATTTTSSPDDAKSAQRRAKNEKRAARRAAAAARNADAIPTADDGEEMIGAASISGTDDGGKETEGGVVLS